jgi:hypothetical protein
MEFEVLTFFAFRADELHLRDAAHPPKILQLDPLTALLTFEVEIIASDLTLDSQHCQTLSGSGKPQ